MINHLAARPYNILGTFYFTSGPKGISKFAGFTISVLIIPNIEPPSPKLATIIPDTNPSLFGKYYHATCKGTTYVNPLAKPYVIANNPTNMG